MFLFKSSCDTVLYGCGMKTHMLTARSNLGMFDDTFLPFYPSKCFVTVINSKSITPVTNLFSYLKKSERLYVLIRKFCQSFQCDNEVEIPPTITDCELFWGRDEMVEEREGVRETQRKKKRKGEM